MLTKTEIAKAVEAIRALTDVIERLEKATWPESQSDVLRKLAEPKEDAAARALAILGDAERRIERLEAQNERRETAREAQ
jgi:predicted CopG family antitoxin